MKYILLLALVFSNIAWSKSGVIKKIYLGRDEASAEFLADYKAYPKNYLIARFANGKNCYLEIKKVYKKLALLDLRTCIYRHFIKEGQTLSRWEDIENDVDKVSVTTPPKDKLSRKEDFWFDPIEEVVKKEKEEKERVSDGFAISIFYSFANEIETSGSLKDGSKLDSIENTNGAFGLGVEYLYTKEMSIGWNAGWTLDILRNIKKREVNVNGTSSTESIDETLWLNTIFANVNFTFPWKIILFGGLNLSFPLERGNKINTKPALGGQVGIAKIISGRCIIDFQYRWINFSGAGEYTVGNADWDSANLNGSVLSVKYLFE